MSVKKCETGRFTDIIKQALDEQERSQAWLSRKCGLTYAAMNRIIQGKAIDISVRVRMSRASVHRRYITLSKSLFTLQ